MVPRALLEAKVQAYLKKGRALEVYWQRPLEGAELQAELDRMASRTRDARTLRELYAALDNDPALVAECLARPILADRILRDLYARDPRFQGAVKALAVEALSPGMDWNTTPSLERHFSRTVYVRGDATDFGRPYRAPLANEEVVLDPVRFGEMGRQCGAVDALPVLQDTRDAYIVTRTLSKGPLRIEVESLYFPKRDLEEWLKTVQLPKLRGSSGALSTSYSLPSIAMGACAEGWYNGSLDDVPDPRENHTAVWTGSEMIVWGGGSFRSGGRYTPSTDSWVPTSMDGACPAGRKRHCAVWTGTEMVVWGGGDGYDSYDMADVYFNSGGRFNPSTDTWRPTSTGANCPAGRELATAVWTGTEMIVWGGHDHPPSGNDRYFYTGGRYDPSTDTWQATPTTGITAWGRSGHTAIWTGNEMIVWGGYCYQGYLNTGGRYNPATNTWTATSTGVNCPTYRTEHSAVWTGGEMIVWGGSDEYYRFNTGGRYNPVTNLWSATSTGTGCPGARTDHTAVWTGTEMIVWGGQDNGGGRYTPDTDTWVPTSSGGACPGRRFHHTMVWTGDEVIVWGGSNYSEPINSGGRYRPVTDTWIATPLGPAGQPAARVNHGAIWTGAEMVVWGGTLVQNGGGLSTATGGRYFPATDSWLPTSTGENCPPVSGFPSPVWTGIEMIVSTDPVSSSFVGGRYNPASDTWLRTSTGSGCPSPRRGYSVVWTGTEMIVWGGGYSQRTNTGARYNPATNSWQPTSTGEGCPSGRYYASAVWTGTQMVIWGGDSDTQVPEGTGGTYTPATDTWTPTSTGAGCPSHRTRHAAVWTGSRMVVWGGNETTGIVQTGGQYNPESDAWTPTSTGVGCPVARGGFSWVWTGTEMIIWGGSGRDEATASNTGLNSGARYSPAGDSWLATPTGASCASGRWAHSAVWTGEEMIIWGGYGGSAALASGGRYSPVCECPTILVGPDELPDGSLGAPYHQMLTASGGAAPYAYAISAGALPPGLALSASGLLSGTPTAQGSFAFTVTATETHMCSGSRDFSLDVSCTSLGTPVLTGVFDESECAQNGIRVMYTPAEGALGHDLYEDGSLVSPSYAPGALFNPGDTASHSYVVRARRGACSADSSTVVGADADGTPLPAVWGESANQCPSISVHLSTDPGMGSYQWYQNGAPVSNANGPTYEATATGSYTVSYWRGSCQGVSTPHAVTVSICAAHVQYDPAFDTVGSLVPVCGDGDAVVEPGEQWQVSVRLKNSGNSPAADVFASLTVNQSSQATGTVSGSPASFGSIGAGGTAVGTFQFVVDPSALCNSSLVFDLAQIHDSSSGFPDQAPAFSVPVGANQSGGTETATQVTSPLSAEGAQVESDLSPPLTLVSADGATLSFGHSYRARQVLFGPDEFSTGIPNWTAGGSAAWDAGTAHCSPHDNGVARLKAPSSSLTLANAISTVGFTAIHVRFDYHQAVAANLLYLDYYDGLSWTQVASFTADSAWNCNQEVALPLGAEGKAGLKVRFRMTGALLRTTDVDAVSITGVSASEAGWSSNARVSLVAPNLAATIVKEFGSADASPYDVSAVYSGPGTYRVRLEEGSGGTASVASCVLLVTRSGTVHCTIGSCGRPAETAPGTGVETAQTWNGKTLHAWPENPQATSGYRVLRGGPGDLPHLLDSTPDSCLRWSGVSTSCVLAEEPVPGSFYWYLVVGVNSAGEGTAGNATASVRVVNSATSCP